MKHFDYIDDVAVSIEDTDLARQAYASYVAGGKGVCRRDSSQVSCLQDQVIVQLPLQARNDGELRFVREESSGAEMDGFNSRATTLLDFDHDGDLDVAVSAFHAEARLFRNDLPSPDRHWLQVELVGDPARGSNRDAIGAEVIVSAASGLKVWRMVTGGVGYLANVDHPMHVGLGRASVCDLEIRWPGGELQVLEGIAGNQRIRVRQGSEELEILPAGTLQKSPQ